MPTIYVTKRTRQRRHNAKQLLIPLRAAGLVVIDSDDKDTVRRIAGCHVIREYGECPSCDGSVPCGPHGPYDVCDEHDELADDCPEFARVLAVLRGGDRG